VRHLTDRHNELVILTILTLVRGALVPAHEEVSMTCRVAQSSQDHVQIDLVYWCECASASESGDVLRIKETCWENSLANSHMSGVTELTESP
jgi:hypothetical protein